MSKIEIITKIRELFSSIEKEMEYLEYYATEKLPSNTILPGNIRSQEEKRYAQILLSYTIVVKDFRGLLHQLLLFNDYPIIKNKNIENAVKIGLIDSKDAQVWENIIDFRNDLNHKETTDELKKLYLVLRTHTEVLVRTRDLIKAQIERIRNYE